jgi:hypothetical protein
MDKNSLNFLQLLDPDTRRDLIAHLKKTKAQHQQNQLDIKHATPTDSTRHSGCEIHRRETKSDQLECTEPDPSLQEEGELDSSQKLRITA